MSEYQQGKNDHPATHHCLDGDDAGWRCPAGEVPVEPIHQDRHVVVVSAKKILPVEVRRVVPVAKEGTPLEPTLLRDPNPYSETPGAVEGNKNKDVIRYYEIWIE